MYALKALDAQVDELWTDIVDAIPQMYVSYCILFCRSSLCFWQWGVHG